MNKQKSLDELAIISQEAQGEGKKVGLVTGCFDIVHAGHVGLLSFAKSKVDTLIVGLDSDTNVKKLKGKGRPVNNYYLRHMLLSEFSSVDYIFAIDNEVKLKNEESDLIFKTIYEKLCPSHLFSSPVHDPFWDNKRGISSEVGIILTPFKGSYNISTTKIIENIKGLV